MNRLIRLFLDTDLRCSHDGLAEIAAKSKIKVENLTPGELLVFVNSSKTQVKVFAAHNTVASHKNPSGRRLMMDSLRYIPEAFGGSGRIDMDAAIKKALEKVMAKKKRTKKTEVILKRASTEVRAGMH